MSLPHALLRAALLDPEHPAPAGLLGPGARDVGNRFDVYRNNVTASLAQALEDAFPALRSLLGTANFRVLAIRFLRAHPPKEPILVRYGAEIPEFLQEFPHTQAIPYLPDVARLEQALRQSYHAADAAPVDLSPLADALPERIERTGVTLAPAVRVVRSRWPVLRIHAFALGQGPRPAGGAQDVLVARPEFDPVLHVLPPGGAGFVAALEAGACLGAAAEAAAQETPDFDLSRTLGLMIATGCIAALTPPPDERALRP